MGYRKNYNSFSIWKEYCNENQSLIVQLPKWVFSNENNFREFATTGKTDVENQVIFDFNVLDDKLFWRLFDFIQDYFEFDSILFFKFEESRLKRKHIKT